MKLYVEGEISRYYVQTLCMIFFPGAKFSEREEFSENGDSVSVKLIQDGTSCEAEVTMCSGGKKASGIYRETDLGIDTEERLKKRAVGHALYEAGAKLFGFRPEWGILTGVRPAKLAADLMQRASDSGAADPVAEAEQILVRDYCASHEKASLLTSVAQNEQRLIHSLAEDTCSIYVSIPFCPTRCAYCSFVSYSTPRLLSLIPEYIERLCVDIEHIARTVKEIGQKPITIYIGGGTPSILDPEGLSRLLGCISENIDLSDVCEFTLEAGRPDTITREKLLAAKSGGVTRVSINPQTTNNGILRSIGRAHTAEQFLSAYDIADKIGFSCINTDLIAGLPGEDYESFRQSMDTVASLDPENLTVHTFCVKRAAELCEDGTAYSREGVDAGRSVAYSQRVASDRGYLPYYMYKQKNAVGNFENVGFSKPGKEGIYNILIMDEVHSIFAAGAGAVTKLVSRKKTDIERIFMPKYPYEYLGASASDVLDSFDDKVKKFYKDIY